MEATTHAPGSTKHGNTGLQNQHLGSLLYEMDPANVSFLRQIEEDHGESYAMRFIWEQLSIDAIDLPSDFSKHQLNKRWVHFLSDCHFFIDNVTNSFIFRFCYEHGHVVSTSAKGTYEYAPRPYDDFLQLEPSLPLPIPDWRGFRKIWKKASQPSHSKGLRGHVPRMLH